MHVKSNVFNCPCYGGDGTFREISSLNGTQNTGWAWGTVWLDFDNDGELDLYGSNGMVSGEDKDDL